MKITNPIYNESQYRNKQLKKQTFGNKIILPDNFNVINSKAGNALNPYNKVGGKISNVIAGLKGSDFNSCRKIALLPLWSGDKISASGYWVENLYQLSSFLKNGLKECADLIVESYKKGINVIVDAPIINESIRGTHFSDILRRGADNSIYKYWFVNLESDIMLGILGTSKSAQKNITWKLINSPFKYIQDTTTKVVNNQHYFKFLINDLYKIQTATQ